MQLTLVHPELARKLEMKAIYTGHVCTALSWMRRSCMAPCFEPVADIIMNMLIYSIWVQ